MNIVLPIVFLGLGFLIGFAVSLIGSKGRIKLAHAQGKSEGEVAQASLQAQIQMLKATQEQHAGAALAGQQQILALTRENAQLKTRLDEELTRTAQNQDRMKLEFKQLADAILEEKTSKFTEQNKTNLESLLTPLGAKIKEFEKRVEDSYGKETEQRISLRKEIEILNQTNQRISQDAINLTNALKGKTKVQGNLGEIILERVLEKSGLTKGQEYDIQVSLNDEDGRRYQPDVVVHLPENKEIVIDSKVSLTSYERYCSSDDREVCEAELKNHIASIRRHLEGLSLKAYQDLYRLKSLDFVFLFMPIEPALTLAVQNDPELFQHAFERNIVIVSPSTLLAVLRTVSSIWRQEKQNRNVAEIARQSGALYDKFVSFVDDLEKVGRNIGAAQKSFDDARNKLADGTGNLIGRAEKIRLLGAKTTKRLPLALLQTLGPKTEIPDETEMADEEEPK